MPRDALHLLSFSPREQRYILTLGTQTLSLEITTSRDAWTEWLDVVSSFAFENRRREHCTIRKERLQRGDTYWYAYRSLGGRTKKRYLGRTADLSLERLEEVSALFAAEEGQVSHLPSPEQPQLASLPRMKQASARRGIAPALAPLLETKLHPPQLSALLVEREHLLARLDASFAHKLTLLLAPAGFGKTTLVNQWLVARGAFPTFPARAWVSLDPGDNDSLRFWRAVITACQALLGREQRSAGQAALALLSAAVHSPFDLPPIDLALTRLLNCLADPSSGGLLVLDDYHAIAEPRTHEMLAFFIDHLPATVHVLLLSRSEPPLPLLRWRARGELCELHGSDLRFSLEESMAFLQRTLPVPLSEAALTRLDASLEGWAAGLRLLSLTLSGWRTPQAVEQALLSLGERAGSSATQRSLFDYFVSEILETQPELLQHFLLRTSVLSRLNGDLCDAVIGDANSAAQLKTIERAGLFLEALEGPGEWYRYHALFAEAMRREASSRLGEEALRLLSLRASFWYEQEGLFMEAIETAWLARDGERVAQLIELVNERDFSEPRTMVRWLEQLPAPILREHPLLCHLLAVELRFPVIYRFSQTAIPTASLPLVSETERARIETLLQMAREGWHRRGMLPWIGTNWAFRLLSGLLDREPFSALVNYARQALTFLPQMDTLDSRLRMYRSACRLFLGIEKLRLGLIGEALQLFLQAQEDNVPPGNMYLAIDIRLMLGRVHLIQGELQQACSYFRQVYVDARELADDETISDVSSELAWLAFERNDLPLAEQQASEALEAARRLHPQLPELVERAELQFALLQYVRGETVPALEQLTAILAGPQREWMPTSFWLHGRLFAWQGRLRIATGDLQALQDSLDGCSQSDAGVSMTDHLGAEILQGRLLLAQGEAMAALQQFARLLLLAREHLHQYVSLEIQLLLALAHVACKQEQQAHYWLRQTLARAVHEGYVRLFLNEGKPLTRLLRSLLPDIQDKALRAYAQSILRAEAQGYGPGGVPRAGSLAFSGDVLPEPLSAQEQRVLRLLVAGGSNADIARELVISVNTVKYHVKHLYQKLGVSNRLQASEVARDLKLG